MNDYNLPTIIITSGDRKGEVGKKPKSLIAQTMGKRFEIITPPFTTSLLHYMQKNYSITYRLYEIWSENFSDCVLACQLKYPSLYGLMYGSELGNGENKTLSQQIILTIQNTVY